MRRFRRSGPHDGSPVLDALNEPSAPPTTDSVSSRLAAPDGLTGSNLREQERLFSAFLHEIGVGDHKRQTDFLSFCRSVEEAFDVAQAERRAQLRSIDLSLRAEAKEVHNSLLERAAAAETERDRRSAECLSSSSALRMQLAHIGERYAANMERLQCKVDMALTMGTYTTKQFDDLGHEVDQILSKSERHIGDLERRLPELAQQPEPHCPDPINVPTTTSNIYTRADDSAPVYGASSMDEDSHLRPDTDTLTRLLNGLVVPTAGMDPRFMREIWLRRQEELYSWKTLMDWEKKWDHDLNALEFDLRSKFLAVLPQESAIGADLTPSTLVIIGLRWRTADARRAAGLKHMWATSLQGLHGLVFRHNKAVASKLLSIALPILQPNIMRRRRRLDLSSILLRPFPIGGPLPVLPTKRTRKKVDNIFQQTLSALRVESDEKEDTRQAYYEDRVTQWQSRAAQAERRRQSLFDDAIDRLRAIAQRRISDLAVAGEQLALDLELAFIAAQSSREEAMRLALQTLDQQLQDVAEEALRTVEAAISNITPETSDQ